jgi:hypothetical protein
MKQTFNMLNTSQSLLVKIGSNIEIDDSQMQ